MVLASINTREPPPSAGDSFSRGPFLDRYARFQGSVEAFITSEIQSGVSVDILRIGLSLLIADHVMALASQVMEAETMAITILNDARNMVSDDIARLQRERLRQEDMMDLCLDGR